MTIDRTGRRPPARHPHRAARWLTGLIIAGFMGPASLLAQPRLYVQAVDSLDAIVTDLGRDAIIVRENGVERRVIDVRPANLPMKITILVDNSQVTANAYVHIREGLHRFLRRLPPNQIVSILTFAGQPRWLVRPTTDREELAKGVDNIAPDVAERVRYLDALIEATERTEDDEDVHRPVVVMFTALGDEMSTLNRDRYAEFLHAVQRTGITVHTLQLSQPRGRAGVAVQAQIAQDLAQLTGGYLQPIAVATGVDDRFDDIVEVIRARNSELGRQLRVVYERPDEDEVITEISVDLLRDDVTFQISLDGRLP